MNVDPLPTVRSSVVESFGNQIQNLQTTMGWSDQKLALALGLRVQEAKDLMNGSGLRFGHALRNLEQRTDLPQGTTTMLKLALGELYPNQWSIFGDNDGLTLLSWGVRHSNLTLEQRQNLQNKIDNLARGFIHTVRGTVPDGATE